MQGVVAVNGRGHAPRVVRPKSPWSTQTAQRPVTVLFSASCAVTVHVTRPTWPLLTVTAPLALTWHATSSDQSCFLDHQATSYKGVSIRRIHREGLLTNDMHLFGPDTDAESAGIRRHQRRWQSGQNISHADTLNISTGKV